MKKRKVLHRVAALMCALVLVMGCMGSVPYYAHGTTQWAGSSSYENLKDANCSNNYHLNATYQSVTSSEPLRKFVIGSDSPVFFVIGLKTRHDYVSNNVNYGTVYSPQLHLFSRSPIYILEGSNYSFNQGRCYVLNDGSMIYSCSYTTGIQQNSSELEFDSDLSFIGYYEHNSSSTTLEIDIINSGFFDIDNVKKDSYNSDLGYLQNIRRKYLTLFDENDVSDINTAQIQFSFDSQTTTGLDITSGGYSVRHYMTWEVVDKDSKVVRSYDVVFCDEYDAAGCKISYPLVSTRTKAQEDCGFEPLSWYESGILGYEFRIYDYLQLVRTNEDGSVEYGGYVRIDENGFISDTLDDNFAEDPNGYLDKDVPSSSGTGSSYDNAENDADKNESSSGSDLTGQISGLLSTITVVPKLFASLFSFLPEWCLDLIGVSVGLGALLVLWKAGRG